MNNDGHSDDDDVIAPLARHLLWLETPLGLQKVIRGLMYLCGFLFVVDIFWHRHAYVPGEGLWGFHAIAGFVAFTLIVLGAKALRTLIKRDETYYAPYSVDAEAYPEAGLARREAGSDADGDAEWQEHRSHEGLEEGKEGMGGRECKDGKDGKDGKGGEDHEDHERLADKSRGADTSTDEGVGARPEGREWWRS